MNKLPGESKNKVQPFMKAKLLSKETIPECQSREFNFGGLCNSVEPATLSEQNTVNFVIFLKNCTA